MRSVNASASGSRRPSAGSRRSPARSEPSSAAASASDGPSPARPQPTIGRGCRSCWRPRREGPGQLPPDRPLADRRVRSLGSSSSRSETPGDPDDHRARWRNRFGALEAVLEVEYARDSIAFRWNGCEEGDQVEGEGPAELPHDETIESDFPYHNGDEAALKAKRVTSSTAC